MTDDGFFEDYGDFDWGFDDKETSDSETDSTGQIERKFSHLSVTNGGDEGDLACHEEDDKAFEAYEDELLAAYLRFRSFFNGSKQQLKRLTFDRYRELLDEAIRQALHARISPETDYISGRPDPVVLEPTHLEAFRLSSPSFFAENSHALSKQTSTHAEQSSMANAVTVEFHFFSPDASAGVIEASTVPTSNGH